MANDTIVAPATPPGESAVAITRLSGPDALTLASTHFRGRIKPADSPSHRILLGSFLDSDGAPLDRVLLSVFRAPRSYTGEDLVEISSHGGLVVPRLILDALVRSGARPASPGEFTERAFRNGKLDLAQAESVAQLVRSRSEQAARTAGKSLGGSLSRRLEELDRELVLLQSEVESRIDFPADVGELLDGEGLAARCRALAAMVRDWTDRAGRTRRAHEGLRAALVGKPNAGKSSILNALVGYDRAIVTPSPGTTRDTVEESVQIGGIEVRVADTAGIAAVGAVCASGGWGGGCPDAAPGGDERHDPDAVERLGIQRSAEAARSCDLAVLVLDRSTPLGDLDMEAAALVRERPVVVAWNKADLPSRAGARALGLRDLVREVETVAIRPGGVDTLIDAIESAISRMLEGGAGAEAPTTSARQEGLLSEALRSLERAERGLRDDLSYDLVAVDLADARRAVAHVVGRGVDDAVIREIFSRFCIGK